MTDEFWEEQADQSRVKTDIVVAYLDAWWQIMKARATRVAYVDLYSGPGRFRDGTESTPLKVLRKALEDARLSSSLMTLFNDIEIDYSRQLEFEIQRLPGIGRLRFPPIIKHGPVSDDIEHELETAFAGVPTLSFLDPWGYKGLSANLLGRLVQGFGCDAIFFFNYNRVQSGVSNDRVEAHMRGLFGALRLAGLRDQLRALPPQERERAISRALADSLAEHGAPLMLPFKVWTPRKRISHYLCFITKNKTAYLIMKEIMAQHGWADEDGVPRLEYVPQRSGRQLQLFEVQRPIRNLGVDLARTFQGRTLQVRDVVSEHNVGTPFVKANYKKVLLEMEAKGQVACEPPADRRRKQKGRPTLADTVRVTFPPSP
ncbi:MAG TPA: three-Cys-motif partner protein TcmP [Dehalococcoidia bacterium]|nr:three-Cys-motif partner protein TcmP [Dehalococcoidia bacterium]